MDNLEEAVSQHMIRSGDWYSATEMSNGIHATMGRMYVCTGSGICVKQSNGSNIIATDNTNLSSSGHKAVAFILPNTLSRDNNYRCKMITIDDGLLTPTFEAKDFTLDSSVTEVVIYGTGGTSIWTV